MNKTSYNGWQNYETWKVKLELLSNYEPYHKTAELLADELKQFCEEIVDCETTQGFARDCANQILRQVDWMEIAKHILE